MNENNCTQETARSFVSLESLDKTWSFFPWICMQQCIDETEDPKIHNMKQKFTNVPVVKNVNRVSTLVYCILNIVL